MSHTKETRTFYRIRCDACGETEQAPNPPSFRFAWQPDPAAPATLLDVCRECQAKHTGEALRKLLSSPSCRDCGEGHEPGETCGPCGRRNVGEMFDQVIEVIAGKPIH